MTLDTLIKEARALELSEKTSQIEHKSAETTMFKKKKKARNIKQHVPQKKIKTVKCRNCGLDYPHKDSKCPAEGKTCNFCKKKIILQVYIMLRKDRKVWNYT